MVDSDSLSLTISFLRLLTFMSTIDVTKICHLDASREGRNLNQAFIFWSKILLQCTKMTTSRILSKIIVFNKPLWVGLAKVVRISTNHLTVLCIRTQDRVKLRKHNPKSLTLRKESWTNLLSSCWALFKRKTMIHQLRGYSRVETIILTPIMMSNWTIWIIHQC